MAAIMGFFSSLFSVFRRRQHTTPSDQELNDIGAIMDENYYKRDIVIAGKKISTSPYLQERLHAVRDVGHLAWLGGSAAAKFASNHLMEFMTLLGNDIAPLELKKAILFSIVEICACTRENQEKARGIGLLTLLYDLLESPEATLRRGATACLVILVSENYDNHLMVMNLPNLKERLLTILQDDWRAWKRNEAARLILMLGLNRVGDTVMELPK